MKLQLAIDVLESSEALHLAEVTRESVDIIEIGTPLIKHEGIKLVRTMRENFPDKEILVDLKTMDVGEYESDFCFEAGADIVTVLGAADIKTIVGSVKSARSHGGQVVADLINVPDKLKRAMEVEAVGVDYVGIHTGIDRQQIGATPLADLRALKGKVKLPIVVAGGINLSTIDDIVKLKPEVVVVGSTVASAKNPAEIAQLLKEKLL